MLMSQVDPERSECMKKRFCIAGEDEYNCSSEVLNDLVLSSVLSAMPSYQSSRKVLKRGYIADLVREGGISPWSLLLGLIYIRRLAETNPDYLTTVSSRDLFLIAMVVASKYMNDEGELEALSNSDWAAIGVTPKRVLDNLEYNFLKAIDWRLYVPLQEFYTFVSSVEGRIAMQQARRRGWLTYTELAAFWESSDLQASMLKHTAKVAWSGATIYLMCVSTLLAAAQSLSLPLFASETATPLSQPQQDAVVPGYPPSVNQTYEAVCRLTNASTDRTTTTTANVPRLGWEEVWPGGKGGGVPLLSMDDDIPTLDSPLYQKMMMPKTNFTGQRKWLRSLLTSDPSSPAALPLFNFPGNVSTTLSLFNCLQHFRDPPLLKLQHHTNMHHPMAPETWHNDPSSFEARHNPPGTRHDTPPSLEAWLNSPETLHNGPSSLETRHNSPETWHNGPPSLEARHNLPETWHNGPPSLEARHNAPDHPPLSPEALHNGPPSTETPSPKVRPWRSNSPPDSTLAGRTLNLCNHNNQFMVKQTPLPRHRPYNVITMATVDGPQAADLNYRPGGTFHWNPLINSSLEGSGSTSMAGALSFVAKYLMMM